MGKNDLDPRQMAQAPRNNPPAAPQPEPVAPVNGNGATSTDETDDTTDGAAFGRLPKNPFGFGSVIFKAASLNAKAYDENGRKTKKIANVLVELGGNSRLYLKGSIKAVLYTGRTKPVAEFGFFGAQNQGSCIATDDLSAQAAMETIKASILKLHTSWRAGQKVVASIPAGAVELDDVSI